MGKNTINIFGTTTGIFSFVGWMGAKLLKLFGAMDMAMNLKEFMELIDGTPINWEALYFYVFLLCLVSLIYTNWYFFEKKINEISEEINKSGDKNMPDSVSYIIYESYFGETLDGYRKHEWAWATLKEAIEKKRIDLFGLRKGSFLPSRIKKKDIKNLQFRPKYKYKSGFDRKETEGLVDVKIIDPEKEEEVVFEKLSVRDKDLKKIWKPHYKH